MPGDASMTLLPPGFARRHPRFSGRSFQCRRHVVSMICVRLAGLRAFALAGNKADPRTNGGEAMELKETFAPREEGDQRGIAFSGERSPAEALLIEDAKTRSKQVSFPGHIRASVELPISPAGAPRFGFVNDAAPGSAVPAYAH